jgi:hypothetical protein
VTLPQSHYHTPVSPKSISRVYTALVSNTIPLYIILYEKWRTWGADTLDIRWVRNSLRCRVAASQHKSPTTLRAALECVLYVFYARSCVGGEDAYHVEA